MVTLKRARNWKRWILPKPNLYTTAPRLDSTPRSDSRFWSGPNRIHRKRIRPDTSVTSANGGEMCCAVERE